MPANHAKLGGTVIQGSFAHGFPSVLQARLPTMSPAAVQAKAPLPFSGQPVQAKAAVPPKVIAPPPIRFPGQPVPTAQAKPAPGIPGKAPLPFTVPLPKPVVQPKGPALVAVQPKAVQLSGGGQAFRVPLTLNLSSPGGGQRLPEAVQQKMESFFGTSFADVRVHVGAQASSIGALAFTHGSHLYFAPGQYHPHTAHGQQLLGHELTHVVQQRAGRVRNPSGSGVAVVQDHVLEAEADRMGIQAASTRLPAQANRSARGNPWMAARTGAVQPKRLPGASAASGLAIQRMKRTREWEKDNRGDKLFHPPSPTASPLRDDQEAILKEVRKEMRTFSQKKTMQKPQPKESVKGRIGEVSAALCYEAAGIPCVDANVAIQKNIDGIDHIIKYGSFCFSQSKVHISGAPAAIARQYETEINNRDQMATAFVKKMLRKGTTKTLTAANHTVRSKALAVIIQGIDELIKVGESPEDVDDSLEVVQLVANAILFPVPSDVYDLLKKSSKSRASPLDYDVEWSQSSLRKSYYMQDKRKLTKEEREERDDETFFL